MLLLLACAFALKARRHALRVLGDRDAVDALFDYVAPQFEERNGGYTRVVRLSTVRLGDAGAQAILEFVGKHDRVATRRHRLEVEPQSEPEESEAASATESSESDTAETAEAGAEAASEAVETKKPAKQKESKKKSE